ncbi:hypothetical protein LTR84_007919 [Exophiala bonariae]|uniref:CTLH domain-containing protein n=1 Tax=Exophiala bonariae TaxID=1690606 RepID=A0AAV9NQA3_9EURO|nr:hypothetical protein LTR84_007919 [Exophiala bonariae]
MAPEPHEEMLKQLLSPSTHPLFSLPVSPCKPIIDSSRISDLSLHPVLESLLHILNLDLPSAHFLLRHMQAAPAYEAMYLHGILHRIEGDLDNTRAWYRDVQDSDVFRAVWSGEGSGFGGGDEDVTRDQQAHSSIADDATTDKDSENAAPGTNSMKVPIERALSFIDQLARARAPIRSGHIAPASLIHTSLDELSRVWQFCKEKFGTEPVVEASNVWVSMAEKNADIAEKMITGGEGWREF